MKAIDQLNNEERVRLLVQLFPEMKLVILEKMETIAKSFLENEEEILVDWNNPLIFYHEWRSIVLEMSKVIAKSKTTMLKNDKQFCLLSFLGFRGLFTIDCILKIVVSGKYSKRFNAVALALLGTENSYQVISEDQNHNSRS